MSREEAKIRKTRSDKKKDFKPILPIEIYENVSRISYITNKPLKDVGENFIESGLVNQNIIEKLSARFVHDYWLNGTMFISHMPPNERRTLKMPLLNRKLSIRLNSQTQRNIA